MRPGLKNWSLMAFKKKKEENGDLYESFNDWDSIQDYFKEEKKIQNKFHRSMFPLSPEAMVAIGIEKTARILPHDNDTGGFFIAKIRKMKSNEIQ